MLIGSLPYTEVHLGLKIQMPMSLNPGEAHSVSIVEFMLTGSTSESGIAQSGQCSLKKRLVERVQYHFCVTAQ